MQIKPLTFGRTKQLSKISKVVKNSAIKMWEDYYVHPGDFILGMYESLLFRDSDVLKNITSSIISRNEKVIALEVKRTTTNIKPLFYLTAFILALAIIVGLSILTGIEGKLSIFGLPPNNLISAVAVPVILSFIGIGFCLLIIRKII